MTKAERILRFLFISFCYLKRCYVRDMIPATTVVKNCRGISPDWSSGKRTFMNNEKVDLEALYDSLYQRMVRIAATKQEFLNYLEPEDALQDAGEGWCLGVYAWLKAGRGVPAILRPASEISPDGDMKCASHVICSPCERERASKDEIIKAGLPIPYFEYPELEEFHKFLNGAIYKHLREVTRKEYRYQKRLFKKEFDEDFLAPDMSIDEILEEQAEMEYEEWQLEVLRKFLQQPACMEMAGLTTVESVIIYKSFRDDQAEYKIAKYLGISRMKVHRTKELALEKLKHFLS